MSVFKSQDIAKKAHFYSERDSEKRMERLHFRVDSIMSAESKWGHDVYLISAAARITGPQ